VGFLDNGEVGVFRTQENASQQKKNQVATPQNCRKKHPNLWESIRFLGRIALFQKCHHCNMLSVRLLQYKCVLPKCE
jgi:hypothetical protein